MKCELVPIVDENVLSYTHVCSVCGWMSNPGCKFPCVGAMGKSLWNDPAKDEDPVEWQQRFYRLTGRQSDHIGWEITPLYGESSCPLEE